MKFVNASLLIHRDLVLIISCKKKRNVPSTSKQINDLFCEQSSSSSVFDKFVVREVEVLMSNLLDKVVRLVEDVGKKKNQRGANRRESHLF